MLATKCDICGNVIDEDIEPENGSGEYGRTLIEVNGKYIDSCPDCLKTDNN